ncbi:MAG TPA: response regulator [Spirochaetales bacterium]|nr:response regulator [Spirochaetales bacterium]
MARIEIIDDDVELAENFSLVLKKEGHTVSIRDQVEGALEELLQNKPDLLILDVMFPENPAGGFDLARKIKQTEEIKDLPVILLTAINQEFPMDFSARDIDQDWMPVQDFVEKPVNIPDLIEKVNKMLAEGK